MVDDGLIKAGVAPSYYIEGLLYNVPNEKLTSSYRGLRGQHLELVSAGGLEDRLRLRQRAVLPAA
jgi:hypothetical protein